MQLIGGRYRFSFASYHRRRDDTIRIMPNMKMCGNVRFWRKAVVTNGLLLPRSGPWLPQECCSKARSAAPLP